MTMAPRQAENTNKGRSSVRYGQPQHQGVPILGEVGRGTPKGDNPTANVTANVNLALTQMTNAMVSMASQETAILMFSVLVRPYHTLRILVLV